MPPSVGEERTRKFGIQIPLDRLKSPFPGSTSKFLEILVSVFSGCAVEWPAKGHNFFLGCLICLNRFTFFARIGRAYAPLLPASYAYEDTVFLSCVNQTMHIHDAIHFVSLSLL